MATVSSPVRLIARAAGLVLFVAAAVTLLFGHTSGALPRAFGLAALGGLLVAASGLGRRPGTPE